ncbi:MAG: DMT family transporter [Pseudobdellovibrio sp.]
MELTLAGVLWGSSFTLVRWGLDDFSAPSLLFWRYLIAFVIGELFLLLTNKKQYDASWGDSKLAVGAGVYLGAAVLLQSYALKHTTATNAGFITSLYVIIIPFLMAVFYKHKVRLRHIALSITAFAGMGLLLNLQELQVARGELLTLCSAFVAAMQIISIGRAANKTTSPFRFNNYQIFWSLLSILPFLIYDNLQNDLPVWPAEVHLKSVVAIVTLSVSVSIFACFLQVRAQRILSTTTSSMLCLLEGPFAFFFGFLFLQERLGLMQALGAIIILSSCALSVFLDRPQNG